MANKTHATEWLEKSYHDLDSAKILFEAGHFTVVLMDTICKKLNIDSDEIKKITEH